MEQSYFVRSHPLHTYSLEDKTDYSGRDEYFIRCLQAIETMTDIDAYIIDLKNQRILYATQGGTLYSDSNYGKDRVTGLSWFDKIIAAEDLPRISVINHEAFNLYYSLPAGRRKKCYFTQDFRIKVKNGATVMVNHKETVLDLTESGTLRLTLCVISYPTSDKPGNAYIKMTDTNTVYEFIKSSGKFIEVKTQKLTSKATSVLKLSSNGKNEVQIAKELGISINTVKYHKKRIFSQLGVKNTAEAIQWMNNQKKMIRR